jgi:hypothetical protein
MGFAVGLVFHDNQTETDVTGGDQERNAGDTDEGEEGPKDQTDDTTKDEGGDGLDDGAESDAGKAWTRWTANVLVRHAR